jgi:hypothetical protein
MLGQVSRDYHCSAQHGVPQNVGGKVDLLIRKQVWVSPCDSPSELVRIDRFCAMRYTEA